MSERTSLEDILGDTSPQLLDQPCHDKHLWELARHVVDWPYLAIPMGIMRPEVEEILGKCPGNVGMQKVEFLRVWRYKRGIKGTYRKLCKTFWKIEEIVLAEKVHDILCSRKSESSSDESEEEWFDAHSTTSSVSTTTPQSKELVCLSETPIPLQPPPPPFDPFPPSEGISNSQVSETAAVHIPTLQASNIEQVGRNSPQESQVPPPPPSVLPPGVRERSYDVRQRPSPSNPPSGPNFPMSKLGREKEGAHVGTLYHPSPDSTSEQVNENLQMLPATSAYGLPTLSSLVISESRSDESERQLLTSESGYSQRVHPLQKVKYSSGSHVDSLATSKQGDRASKESHVLPSYSRSPLPEPQQVRSSSGPDTLQQPPLHSKPPSIPVAGESEGQLPPAYSLPHPAPMDAVPQNSTHHFPPPSLDPRFQPQEVQQIPHYPPYQISPPTHEKYSPPTVGELGPDDLVDVLTELLDASSNWENIGLGLRLSPGILQALKGPFKPPGDCLRDMLREWLNRSPDPSWQNLIRVLRSPIVGKDTLASHLEARYYTQEGRVLPSGTVIGTPYHSSPVCMATHVSYPASSQTQLSNSASVLHIPASLLTLDNYSDDSQRVSHVSNVSQTHRLPPSKRVEYSSLDLASSEVGNNKETLTPSSTVPTPRLVRSSPQSPQLLPSYSSPPSIKVGEPGEEQLPPGYYLPSPVPMVTVTPNRSLHTTSTSADTRSQPQEVQQVYAYQTPLRDEWVPNPGGPPTSGGAGIMQPVHPHSLQMPKLEPVQCLTRRQSHGQVDFSDTESHLPRPVANEGEVQPPPGYPSPTSMLRGTTAPNSSIPASLPSLDTRSQTQEVHQFSEYPQYQSPPMPSGICLVPTTGHHPPNAGGDDLSESQQVYSHPPTLELVCNPQQHLFADYLRATYEVQIPGFLATQWPPPPTHKVFNLSLIHSETIRYMAPNDELVRLLMTGCVPEYVRRNTSVEMKDLFRFESQGRKFVLIEGAPGSGKSTLAWHIVRKWKARELFQEFKVVIFVQLRDPETQAAQSVADLLPTGSEERKKDAVSRMRSCCGKGVLFVLDGWDEYPLGRQRGSVIQKLICKPQMLDLQFSTLLVTSRPITSAVLHRYASSRVEVVGFTPIEVRQYFEEALGDAKSVQNLENQLKDRPIVEASCFLPLNAAIVVHLFRELNQVLPPTLHGIFSALVCGCLVRHLSKQSDGEEVPEIPSLEEIPSIIQKSFETVCNLAYRGAMYDKVTFSRHDLSSYDLSPDLIVLSLMQGVQSFASRKSMLYHFLHLSVQELLAAHHISKLSQSEQVQVFKELFSQPRFAAVCRFYAAFTKLQTEGIRDVVASIVQSKGKTQHLYLLHCLYESQDSSLCSFIASQLNEGLDLNSRSPFSGCRLSPLDCLSVGYFLSCVCQTTEGEFKVNLVRCSLNDYSVSLLVKELSKCDCPSPCVEGADTYLVLPGCLALDLDGNEIKGGGVQGLSELISHSKVLSKLDLSSNKIQEDGDGLKYLLQGLRTNTSIVEVVLEDSSLRVTEDNGPLLMDMLRENTTLKVLDFNANPDLLTSGLEYISKGLCCNIGLVQLSLSACGVTEKEAKSLAKILIENNTVKSLDLSSNKLGSDGIFRISSSLKVNSILQKLNIINCSLSAEGIKVLVDSLLSNTSLVCLYLSYNRFSDAGAAHIADLLRHNTRLTEVRLVHCNITDRGAQSLAAAFSEHKSLEILHLGTNSLLDTGVAVIAEAIRHNHKLRYLGIGGCGLTDQSMESIASALEVNTTLVELDMSDSEGVTERGLLALGESLKKSKGLKALRLYGLLEQVTTEGWKLFMLCLKGNHHLTSLCVDSLLTRTASLRQEVVAVNEARKQQGLPLLKLT